jgi:TRAP-type uncharacterized transport system substrate-binding protein
MQWIQKKISTWQFRFISVLTILSIILIVASCDIATPQKKFILAQVKNDYFYSYVTGHLKPFLEKRGYHIEIVEAKNAIEANDMVAKGAADLTFINNHSVSISDNVEFSASDLRTITPLATRLFFAFTKDALPDTATIRELITGKNIGIETLNGELYVNLLRFLETAKIRYNKIVTYNDNPDVIVFWGTLYGERATRLMSEGWKPFSFKENWIKFMTLNEPSLRAYHLPAIPGDIHSTPINTIATETVLVTNKNIGENAVYELAQIIFKNKLELFHYDIMYRAIYEEFDKQSLLYPLHEGTVAFLEREQPTFLERYADTIALIFSILAIIYGTIQTIRNRIAKTKKDRIDLYFIDFLEIRSNKSTSIDDKVRLLDNLFHRAVEQMTNEKLEKSDFHILSRLIQQELTIINIHQH